MAAVGNDGPFAKPRYPSAYSNVIGVGAVDRHGRAYRKSGRGAHVEFTAPGVGVIAASGSSATRLYTGTPFAAPLVSGLLLRRLNQVGDADAALEALRGDIVDLGRPGTDPIFGRGVAGRSLLLRPLEP